MVLPTPPLPLMAIFTGKFSKMGKKDLFSIIHEGQGGEKGEESPQSSGAAEKKEEAEEKEVAEETTASPDLVGIEVPHTRPKKGHPLPRERELRRNNRNVMFVTLAYWRVW